MPGRRRCRRRTCGSACAARSGAPALPPACSHRWAIRRGSRRARSTRRRSRPAPRRAARPAPATRSRRWPPAPTSPGPTAVDRRRGSGDGSSSSCTGQRGARRLRRLAQRVQLRQPPDVGDERVVLAGLRCDGVDLVEPELQSVRLLRQFARPLRAVDQVAARGQPVLAQLRGSASAVLLDVDEAVQRSALLVGTHQPQLIVLAVQCEQFGGEACSTTSPARCGRRGRPATDRRG